MPNDFSPRFWDIQAEIRNLVRQQGNDSPEQCHDRQLALRWASLYAEAAELTPSRDGVNRRAMQIMANKFWHRAAALKK